MTARLTYKYRYLVRLFALIEEKEPTMKRDIVADFQIDLIALRHQYQRGNISTDDYRAARAYTLDAIAYHRAEGA